MLAKTKSVRKGERVDRWLVRLRPAVKDKPSLLYGKTITACGRRAAARVLHGEIKVAIPEMLYKTWIVLSDEHSIMSVPNRATANETRNDDGCFNEAPASAKQAGVLHPEIAKVGLCGAFCPVRSRQGFLCLPNFGLM